MGFPLATMLRLASEAVFPLLGFDRFRRDFRQLQHAFASRRT